MQRILVFSRVDDDGRARRLGKSVGAPLAGSRAERRRRHGTFPLADVVRHYSEVNEERLHGMDGQRLIRPLRLTSEETADLVAFLETPSGEVLVER